MHSELTLFIHDPIAQANVQLPKFLQSFGNRRRRRVDGNLTPTVSEVSKKAGDVEGNHGSAKGSCFVVSCELCACTLTFVRALELHAQVQSTKHKVHHLKGVSPPAPTRDAYRLLASLLALMDQSLRVL